MPHPILFTSEYPPCSGWWLLVPGRPPLAHGHSQPTTDDRGQKPGPLTPGVHLGGIIRAPELLSVGQTRAGCHLRPCPVSVLS